MARKTGKIINTPLLIGTRKSPLALAQTRIVVPRLEGLGYPTTIIPLTTSGDRIQDRKLSDLGGKALFTKELEEHLISGKIDMAVHSMKDVETNMRGELVFPCILEREDPRDAFISRDGSTLSDLPNGARLGTSSVRRAAQALSQRPDLIIVPMRGNVGTRLQKLRDGHADATFLALAGLHRLGNEYIATEIIDPSLMLPAAGQGAIGIQCHRKNFKAVEAASLLCHQETFRCVMAERMVLEGIDGSCDTPVGALARYNGETIDLQALAISADGTLSYRESVSCPWPTIMTEAYDLGKNLHQWFVKNAPESLGKP